MISVILPTYLGKYKDAAENREEKLERAIRSVMKQTYQDWQLVIVCDGCDRSFEIAQKFKDERIKILLIDKQPMFSGVPRNVGIEYADGDWIVYLDNDDMFSLHHLELVASSINDEVDWLFFNDYVYNKKKDEFNERTCYLKVYACGTSNIAHRKSIKARWYKESNYGHDDWYFISSLRQESPRWKKVDAEYLVCHIPRRYDA